MRVFYNIFLLVMLLLFATMTCYSQNTHFTKGQVTLQAGIGFFSTLDNTGDYGIGVTYPLKVPPVSLVGDVGVTDMMSIGLYVATAKSDVYYQDLSQKVKLGSLSHVIVGARGLYHFSLIEQLDTYGGVMLGYNAITATGYDNSTGKSSGLTYTVLAGARYSVAKAFGVFLELGYGVSSINLGLSYKIK